MISPDFMKDYITDDEINDLIDKIDRSFFMYRENPLYEWIELIIDGDYSIKLRNIVSEYYIKAGWDTIYHQTSKENGERPGLTSFVFLTEETEGIWELAHDENYRKTHHKVE